MFPIARTDLRAYGIAVFAVGGALAARALLDPVFGNDLPYYLFYFAVIGAAIAGGFGPGLAALILSLGLASYFFAVPRMDLAVAAHEDLIGAIRFSSIGALIALTCGWMHHARKMWTLEARESDERMSRALEQQQVTQRTLASIGDGLITVDRSSRVTFMNPVAEELCGCRSDQAAGRSITEVFRIVNGDTRETVADPTARSMDQDAVVTLPERTLLISRSGGELLIDDSAAPVRDGHGRIMGAVLVFRRMDHAARTRSWTGERGFRIIDVQLVPAEAQLPIYGRELQELERACMAWIEREWTISSTLIRIAQIGHFSVNLRQDSIRWLENGEPGLHFWATYERQPPLRND